MQIQSIVELLLEILVVLQIFSEHTLPLSRYVYYEHSEFEEQKDNDEQCAEDEDKDVEHVIRVER